MEVIIENKYWIVYKKKKAETQYYEDYPDVKLATERFIELSSKEDVEFLSLRKVSTIRGK